MCPSGLEENGGIAMEKMKIIGLVQQAWGNRKNCSEVVW